MKFPADTPLSLLSGHLARLFSKRLAEAMKPLGIAPGQVPVLQALWDRDGQTQRQIVDLLGVEQATIANTLNRMERDGLIKREADKADKRSRRIHLTPKALALRNPAQAALDKVNTQAGRGLYSSDRDRFAALVTKVIGNLAD